MLRSPMFLTPSRSSPPRRPMLLPRTTVWTTQSRPTPTGTPGAAIRISPSMSPTARPTPSHTELNLMMNGTMRMLTSGAGKAYNASWQGDAQASGYDNDAWAKQAYGQDYD